MKGTQNTTNEKGGKGASKTHTKKCTKKWAKIEKETKKNKQTNIGSELHEEMSFLKSCQFPS